jgi:ferredoxin-NADP reductase
MIADATRRRLPHPITLLYANTSAASAPFMDELGQWARENPNFRLAPTISTPATNEPWPFDTGRIDASFVKAHVPDPAAAVFYIAGPAKFVEAMGAILPGIGADPDSVKSEEFPGY